MERNSYMSRLDFMRRIAVSESGSKGKLRSNFNLWPSPVGSTHIDEQKERDINMSRSFLIQSQQLTGLQRKPKCLERDT
jgi:hypothetical protein